MRGWRLLCCVALLAACAQGQQAAPAPDAQRDAAAASADPAPPPAPPCIHTHCYERPARLECAFWKVSPSIHAADACGVWEIRYEGHCDCDMWGVRPAVDGGTH